MNRKLYISAELSLPREAVTSTFVVYGGKGMGKTNFGSVFAEELSNARLRFAVIDPMGVWWGLRNSSDGKAPGIELLILGGVKGDIPIEPSGGAVVADLVVDESVNVLIDISRHANGKMWTIGERIRFVHEYFVQLYARQGEEKKPMMQIVDEAARFAPQQVRSGDVDVAKCLGAVAVMVEEGRNVGVGVCLLTQRSARLNKDVAELADCMIAFRIVGPRSISAVMDWFGEHIEKDRWKDLIAILRKLPIGRALVVSPGWLEFEAEAQIRRRETFDSSATPKPGEKAKTPKGQAAKPDLAQYQKRMAATIERAEANDPKKLQKKLVEMERGIGVAAHAFEQEISSLRRQLEAKPAESVEVPVLEEKDFKRLEKLEGHFESELMLLREKLSTVRPSGARHLVLPKLSTIGKSTAHPLPPRPLPPAPPPPSPPAQDGDTKLAPRHQDIVNAIAFYNVIGVEQCDKTQIAGFVTRSFNGNFRTDLSVLRTAGLVEYPSTGAVVLTQAGKGMVTELPNIRTQADLHQLWLKRLAPRHADILKVLLEAGQVDKRVLAETVGRDFNGNFRTDLSVLKTLGTIFYPSTGEAAPSPNLFPPLPP